jgi:MFS family permease
MRDRRIFIATAFLRALSTGMVGVLLGVYLARIGFGAATIGVLVTCGLAGAAVAALIATLAAGPIGARRFLITLCILGTAGGIAVAFSSTAVVIGIAAFVGMLNGMGRDRGAALIIEQAVLPATTDDHGRTKLFAWYNVYQDIGHALGSMFAGLPAALHALFDIDELTAIRISLAAAALLLLISGLLYTRLTAAVSAPVRQPIKLSPESRRILFRISSLFALDGLGGGFLTASLVSYFFFERFGTGEAVIGGLFFVARGMNAVSHLGAAWLAKRIGLVNTMVFTHIPSSLLLATVAIAPNFLVAAILFLLREGLVEMDVPTRQSYVMAVVKPEERATASGVTHLVRLGAWATAPSFAGACMQSVTLGAPLLIGAGMKITYDILLYRSFRRVRPPEER